MLAYAFCVSLLFDPYQMSDTVQAVENEGEGNETLGSNLGSDGGGGAGRDDGGSVKVDAQGGGSQVGKGAGVETCISYTISFLLCLQ